MQILGFLLVFFELLILQFLDVEFAIFAILIFGSYLNQLFLNNFYSYSCALQMDKYISKK
jgi:hypothetical protein